MGTWGLSHSAEEEWEKAVGQGHVRHSRLRHGGEGALRDLGWRMKGLQGG